MDGVGIVLTCGGGTESGGGFEVGDGEGDGGEGS